MTSSEESKVGNNSEGSEERYDFFTDLLNATEKQIKTFSFNGVSSFCKVSNVYDGDTCRVIFYYGGPTPDGNSQQKKNKVLTRITVRLDNIDTPEMKSDNEHEVELAKQAKQTVTDYILDKICYVQFYKNDKYKRPLADIFPCIKNEDGSYIKTDISISQILIDQGLAREYHGGKKQPW